MTVVDVAVAETTTEPPEVIRVLPQPQRLLRPGAAKPADVALLVASAVSAISLVWIIYYRLSLLEGALGFWLCSYIAFLVIHGLVVQARDGGRAARDRLAAVITGSAALALLTPLVLVVFFVFVKGFRALLRINFFTDDAALLSADAPRNVGGAKAALLGTLQQVALAVVLSVPLGVLCAVYLHEVRGRATRWVRTVVDAMSGTPSIVAGLFIYSVVVVGPLGWGYSGFAGALALSVLMLPTVTRTSEVVLRLVPGGVREAALALGAPEWRCTTQAVLPTARSGLVTAIILGVARAVGETAPLILTIFGTQYVNTNPFQGAQSALPLYVYQFIRQPSDQLIERAWAGALLLMLVVLVLFVIARVLSRSKPERAALRDARRGERALRRTTVA